MREQVGEHLVGGDEAALAVADRHRVHVAHVGCGKPGAQVARDTGVHDAALVTADRVEGERGAVDVHGADVAEGHQAQLDEGLETVADAQDEAVAVLQQVAHRFSHFGGAEEGRDELGGAVGLVAARKAARNHEDLALRNLFGQALGAFGDGCGREVVHDEGVRVGAGGREGAGGIELAVGAGEDGDRDARMGNHAVVDEGQVVGARHGFHGGFLFGGAEGEDVFERVHPGCLERVERDLFAGGAEGVGLGGRADLAHVEAAARGGDAGVVGEFDVEGAVAGGEEVACLFVVVQGKTQAVAQAHLEEGFGAAPVAGRAHREGATRADELFDDRAGGQEVFGVGGEAVLFVGGRDFDHAVAGALELRARCTVDGAHAGAEGHERRRDVEVFEAAGHAILASDRPDAQVDLSHEGAEHGLGGLAPALGHIAQLFEVLLEGEVGVLVLEAGGYELGHAFHHGQVGARELVLFHQVGVESPGHARCGRRGAGHGELGGHGQGRGELAGAAVGHEDRGRADRRIEAVGQAALAADVEVGHEAFHARGQGVALPMGREALVFGQVDRLAAGGAVAREEFAAHVDHVVAVPHDAHAAGVGDLGNHRGFEVLFVGVA